ncbi:MAG TPA: flagellar hook-associated protein 3 [Desulfotomaculum sp.]|jgi:flagellar hook-associated protein 3 FlgL|nr:flagellar hook-associated protein 3 [Desulfotomaculum sp.]
MRVTNNLITQNIIRNLQQNMQEIAGLQQNISSGEKIKRLSDDPSSLWQIMSLKEKLLFQEQYNLNIDNGLLWLNEADRALESATQILQKAQDIALQGANADKGDADLQVMAIEVDSLINQMLDAANTPLGERYLFAGFHKGEKLFLRQGEGAAEEVVFNPALPEEVLGRTEREILPQVKEEVSLNGKELFIDGNIFAHLFNLKNALEAKDTFAVHDCIANLSIEQDLVIQARTAAGTKASRLNLVKEKLTVQENNLHDFLAGLQGSDLAAAATELASRMLAYQATLASATKVLQTSLVNFLG